MKSKMTLLMAVAALSASAAVAQVSTGIPNTGTAPAPTGVVPGGVVPVPAPTTSPAPDLTPPSPIPPPIGVNPVPGFPGQRPNGTPTLNTFSEQQVRSNLMAQGYSGVSGLSVDGTGTWRGTAVRNGSNVNVTIDSNGMVIPN